MNLAVTQEDLFRTNLFLVRTPIRIKSLAILDSLTESVFNALEYSTNAERSEVAAIKSVAGTIGFPVS